MSRSFGDTLADMHVKNQNTSRDERWRLVSQFDFLPLFVTGQEQTGRSHHKLLKDSPRYGVGFTCSETYTLNMHKQKLYPVSLYEADGDMSGRLFGELYLVSPEIIFKLDEMYMNGIYFRRHKRGISFYDPQSPDPRVRKIAMVWMYLGCPDYWFKKRTDGDLKLMEGYTANSGEFYYQYGINDDKDAVPF